MSDNNKHIDDLFRDRFDNFELPVTDADFRAIQDGLKEKRKKRPIIIWWFILGALIIAAGIFTYQLRDKDGTLSDNAHDKTNLTEQKQEPSANKEAITQKVDESKDQEKAADANIQDHGSLFPDQSDQTDASKKANEDAVNNNTGGTSDSDGWSDEDRDIGSDESEGDSDEWDDIFNPKGDKTGSGDGDDVGNSGSGDSKESDAARAERERKELEQKAKEAEEERKRAESEEARKRKEAEEARKRAEDEAEKEKEKEKENVKPLPLPFDSTTLRVTPPTPASPVTFYVGAMVRPTQTRQQLSQENTAHASYSEYKESNEQRKLHLDAGLIFGAKYNNWTLQTGANLSQYQFDQKRIRYQIKDSFPVLNPQGQIIDWIYNNYRDTTVEVPVTGVSYRMISIPVLLGKDINLGDKVGLHFQAGTQLSFLADAKGFTVNSALDIRDVNSLPLKKTHLGWNGSVGLSYRVKPAMAIRVDGNYTNLSGNLYESSYDAKAVLNNVGFKISLMYELGKTK